MPSRVIRMPRRCHHATSRTRLARALCVIRACLPPIKNHADRLRAMRNINTPGKNHAVHFFLPLLPTTLPRVGEVGECGVAPCLLGGNSAGNGLRLAPASEAGEGQRRGAWDCPSPASSPFSSSHCFFSIPLFAILDSHVDSRNRRRLDATPPPTPSLPPSPR